MLPDIHIHNLFYAYPPLREGDAAVPILKGINLQIGRGEFVALLGRVGAGKTTLCMALNGLTPHATGGVFRGDVTILGQNTKQRTVPDLARSVGLVFQDPESQIVQMRVEDEVAFGCENLGLAPAEIEERVAWALAAVGLADYRDRSSLLLSGGEKQRVAIAAMLAMRPQVLVLDEPTASLDPAGKSAIFKVLAELRDRHEMTIVMATQEMERIARFADRVIVLHEGQIGLDGPPQEVFSQVARLQEWGIGAPQMAELGHLLAQRTGCAYRFIAMTDACRVLRRQARKIRMEKRREIPPNTSPGRVHTLAERPQIAVRAMSHVYPDGAVALKNVSLEIRPGEFVALLGPNGSGKTTLAKHLNGLLKPSQGSVAVENRDTRTLRIAELARLVGYAFQNPDHQIFAPTVQEEISFGPRMQELPRAVVTQRVAEALERFRLIPYADLPPALLGFGQRRQVALAAIIAAQPMTLILDEPTGGLDWRSQQEFMEIIAGFNTLGRTVVLITHDMRLVAEYATRAIVLLGGEVLFDGTPRGLFSQPEVLDQAGLALPPVTRLARRLDDYGIAADTLTLAQFAAAWHARLVARGRKRKKLNPSAGQALRPKGVAKGAAKGAVVRPKGVTKGAAKGAVVRPKGVMKGAAKGAVVRPKGEAQGQHGS